MLRTSIGAAVVGLAMSATVSAQQGDETQIKARQRISMMEGVLERAVSNGADNLLRQVRTVMTDVPMLSGVPKVRGFRLDGYGVFFDVEVPALRVPMTWPLRYMVRGTRELERDLEVLALDLRALMKQLDERSQEQFAQLVRRLERRAQEPVSLIGQTASAGKEPSGPAVNAALLENPTAAYTDEVKKALVDAMLENSGALALEADEWLTVAARDNLPRDPLVPGDAVDLTTVIFRVRGRDLTAFREGRVSLEEARQRVDVKEY